MHDKSYTVNNFLIKELINYGVIFIKIRFRKTMSCLKVKNPYLKVYIVFSEEFTD